MLELGESARPCPGPDQKAEVKMGLFVPPSIVPRLWAAGGDLPKFLQSTRAGFGLGLILKLYRWSGLFLTPWVVPTPRLGDITGSAAHP